MNWTTLVDVPTLKAHLDDPDWLVVDVRHQLSDTAYGERVYAEGHLPGAVFLHCDRDLSGPLTGQNGRHPLPDPAVLAERLGAVGIGPNTQVVVYDDAQGMIAGRVWWLLRWLGHTRVALLDGGLPAWLAAGEPLTQTVVTPQPRTLPLCLQSAWVSVDWVQSHLNDPAMRLVDARGPDRFRGENETIDPVGGHIPGAVNRFFKDNVLPDGRFKPADVLRAEWQAILAGAPADTVVHQCGSGVSACLNVLAMEVAGMPGSRLYAGSWSEWCADPARPVAR
ncbi:sulfurtransferase [Dechloromonas sp. ZS-1]|uniref:sulfurtransferase n=1 Tax=Dechloromonas sp. ZS-1 TaxID=3138067 RepID=UPI0031FD7562